jgi:hypothetical protein
MTNDHDDLVSAYLDGQATPAEIERVEGDPELGARVEAFRVVAGRLAGEVPSAPPQLRHQHLALALDAFDQTVPADDSGRPRAAGVADLGLERAKRSEPAEGSAPRSGGRRRREQPGPRRVWAPSPSWLGVAAVLILVAGGIGWLATLDDTVSDTTATEAVDTDSAGDSEADDESAPAPADSGAGADEAEGGDGEATAMQDDGATQTGPDAETTEEAATEDADELTTTVAAGGFFPEEAVEAARRPFDDVPTGAELADLVAGDEQGLLEPALSTCGPLASVPVSGQLIGFVPISVGGRNAEVLVYEAGDGEREGVVVDEGCEELG